MTELRDTVCNTYHPSPVSERKHYVRLVRNSVTGEVDLSLLRFVQHGLLLRLFYFFSSFLLLSVSYEPPGRFRTRFDRLILESCIHSDQSKEDLASSRHQAKRISYNEQPRLDVMTENVLQLAATGGWWILLISVWLSILHQLPTIHRCLIIRRYFILLDEPASI